MTKADRIRTLYASGKSVREICEIVGCSDSYVRVAARQRIPGGNDPNRDYLRRIDKASKQLGNREEARRAWKRAYDRYRAQGLSPEKANRKSGSAYRRAMRKSTVRRAAELTQQA